MITLKPLGTILCCKQLGSYEQERVGSRIETSQVLSLLPLCAHRDSPATPHGEKHGGIKNTLMPSYSCHH